MSGKAKTWVEANFPSLTGSAKAMLILAYGAGLDAGLAEAQEVIDSVRAEVAAVAEHARVRG